MVLTIVLFALIGLIVGFFGWELFRTEKRLILLELTLNGVKPALEEMAKVQNEVRDMREVIDQLPIDDLMAQAEFEKNYADGLAAIAGYSYETAIGAGGEPK